MDRAQKSEMVEQLNAVFKDAQSVVVTVNNGLTVAEVSDLRRQLRAVGASYKVAKNRLALLAIEDTPYKGMAKLFKGPTAIAYANDPVAAAKVAVEFAKKNDKLSVIGGGMGEIVLDANGVKTLANLPSLDELRGKIVGLLQAPATKVAGVVQAPAGQLARVVQAFASKG